MQIIHTLSCYSDVCRLGFLKGRLRMMLSLDWFSMHQFQHWKVHSALGSGSALNIVVGEFLGQLYPFRLVAAGIYGDIPCLKVRFWKCLKKHNSEARRSRRNMKEKSPYGSSPARNFTMACSKHFSGYCCRILVVEEKNSRLCTDLPAWVAMTSILFFKLIKCAAKKKKWTLKGQ